MAHLSHYDRGSIHLRNYLDSCFEWFSVFIIGILWLAQVSVSISKSMGIGGGVAALVFQLIVSQKALWDSANWNTELLSHSLRSNDLIVLISHSLQCGHAWSTDRLQFRNYNICPKIWNWIINSSKQYSGLAHISKEHSNSRQLKFASPTGTLSQACTKEP